MAAVRPAWTGKRVSLTMSLLKWVIRPYLYGRYQLERLTGTGAFGADPAVYLTDPHVSAGNRVKDGLHRFHVKQFLESSCSAATIASVVNTLLERQGSLTEPAVTQQDLLGQVRAEHWKERMSEKGYRGRRGLPLDVLGRVVKASLDTFQAGYRSVETVQARPESDPGSPAFKETLIHRLNRFEEKGDCLLIAHFDQGSFVKEFHIPHISPVGGYDHGRSMVRILDVDGGQAFPYEISFDRFYSGISTDYNSVFRYFGYAEGGYVFIQL